MIVSVALRFLEVLLYAFIAYAIWWPLSRLWRRYSTSEMSSVSEWLDRTKKRVIPSTSSARSAFRSLVDVTVHPSKNHSHGSLAAYRAKAVAMMRALALSQGRGLFMLQRSRRDAREGIPGTRQYYWMKDTDVPASDDEPGKNDIVGIVDTDYYMEDLEEVLSKVSCPVVIYTMTPSTAGEVLHEGLSFSFNADSELCVTVSGGSTFKHRLWDYGVDVITVRSPGWTTDTLTSYDVDRRSISKHSSLIALTPRHRWTGAMAKVASRLKADRLKRFDISAQGWNVMNVQREDSHLVSIAKVDSTVEITIPLEVYEGLRATVKVAKYPVTISMVESQVTRSGINHARAAILCEYLLDTMPKPVIRSYPVEYAVKRFQWGKYEPDAKPSLKPFMAPIVNDALAPDLTKGNEERSINERVVNLQSEELPVTPDLIKYMAEFVEHIIPEPHTVVPVDESVVVDKQSRPNQRYLIRLAGYLGHGVKRVVKAFMKREAYGKYTDPRNISTINPKDKLQYSRVVYAVTEVLKEQPWYAFGKTPKSIAERVAEICRAALSIIPSDYRRLDGTITNLCRMLERALFMRAMAPAYHDEVEELMRTQYKQSGVGVFGTWYLTGWSRLSGSPETSTCNTLVTAFVPYMAFREMGYSPKVAYSMLGVYGGDDGITADIDPVLFKQCAAKMGLTLTTETVTRGDAGIHFLARLYTPKVWFGSPNSCCDLVRQLSKWHTCVPTVGTLDPVDKLFKKAFSFWLTDKNTPIIGPFVRRVKQFMDKLEVSFDPELQDKSLASYASIAPEDEQYPNEPDEWFDHMAAEAFPNYDSEMWYDWLDSTVRASDLLTPPCISDPEREIPPGLTVNGLTCLLEAVEALAASEKPADAQVVEVKEDKGSTPAAVGDESTCTQSPSTAPPKPKRKPRKRKAKAVAVETAPDLKFGDYVPPPGPPVVDAREKGKAEETNPFGPVTKGNSFRVPSVIRPVVDPPPQKQAATRPAGKPTDATGKPRTKRERRGPAKQVWKERKGAPPSDAVKKV